MRKATSRAPPITSTHSTADRAGDVFRFRRRPSAAGAASSDATRRLVGRRLDGLVGRERGKVALRRRRGRAVVGGRGHQASVPSRPAASTARTAATPAAPATAKKAGSSLADRPMVVTARPGTGQQLVHVRDLDLGDGVLGVDPGQAGPDGVAQVARGDRQDGPAVGQAEGGERLAAHAPVAGPLLDARVAQGDDRRPAQGAGHVDHRRQLHGAGAERRPGADHARPGRDHDDVGLAHHRRHRQRRREVDGLEVAAEGLAGRDRHVEQVALDELGHEVGEGQREGSRLGHHVHHPGRRPQVLHHHGHAGHLAVETARHDRAARQVGHAGQLARMVLLGDAGVDLEARVPELHDVPGPLATPRLAGQVPVHDVPAAGAQAQLDGRGVDHHPIARRPPARSAR